MPCPFPGMDPYLESPALWQTFQQSMVVGLGEALQPSVGDRFRLRSAIRTYTNEQVLFTSVVREEHREDFLEIRSRSGDRPVTIVDVISPANRSTCTGRKEYQARRAEVRRANANHVELELVLQGHSCLDITADGLPEFDYAVSVCRARQQERFEIYTTTVQKRLPRIRLPLVPDERDVIVDIQAVFTRCYERYFAGKIDYQKEPPALLEDDDQRWMVQLLKQLKLRS